VLQDVYVRIWLNADKYQVSGYSPITWLVAIARNLCIDRLRSRRPATADIDEATEIADQAATPEQSAMHLGEAGRLMKCLEKLDPERAFAVKAAYMEGHSYQDLAVRLKQPLNTVRTWLRRGLISLRECLSS
jgi:RNA polymerase sigma-70 factor (ECF subfamily)